ncbi:MAG TPA: DUF4129 domain-containing protein [Polyangia bacterium]
MAAAVAPVDAARVIAARDEVLSAPEFNAGADWRTRLIDWLVETLERFSSSLPFFGRVFLLVLLAAALLGVLWLMIPPLRSRLRRPRGKAIEVDDRVAPLGFAAALASARTALASGHFAECVRSVWLGVLALLAQRGLSPERRARTDWEHVRAASRLRPDLEPTLRGLALTFQRAHFGGAPVGADEAATCVAALEALSQNLARDPMTVTVDRRDSVGG